jgi:hypothetical protein
MKKIYSIITAVTMSFSSFAQAPVPTSYDFENGGIYPTGWTLNAAGVGTQYYTSSFSCGSSLYSLKFDTPGTTTGENLLIYLVSQPGDITYNIRANTGSATPWNGNFQLQESVDGLAWTAFKTYSGTGGPTAGGLDVNACQSQTATPTNPNSRYIRFIYVSKTTGNVCLDDINIKTPSLPVGFRVKQGAVQISNGGFSTPIAIAVASTSVIPLTIENIGISNTLTVSSATITGTNASNFVPTSSVPFSLSPLASALYNINFTPSSVGTKTATLTFTTNDPNNLTFDIKLYGVGGLLATAPVSQATGLTFSGVKTYSLAGQFNTAIPTVDGLGGYLVLRNNNGAVVDVPVSGTTYQKGQYIGSSQVVYAGPVTSSTFSFIPSYIRASKTYGFAVFAYNGNGSIISYNTSGLTQTVSTPFSLQSPSEYSSLSVNNPTFLTNLSALINPHTSIYYSNYTSTMIDQFETRDTLITSPVVFTKVITCSYSSLNRPYNAPFDYTGLDFSREHSYCHNWMPTNPADSPEKPEYNDQHNLYPTKQTNVNGVRSNYPIGEVAGAPISSYLDCKIGLDVNGNKVFEPRTNHKGNVARAIMYMATAYNGISGNNWKLRNPISTSINYGQDQNILKKWHYQDLPDSYERSRNDFVESIQGNRNPFIDSVRYACYIDFSNMTYIANPTYTTGIGTPCYVASSVGLYESTPLNFEYILAPNPTSGEFYLMIEANIAETFQLTITDLAGRNMYRKNINVVNGFNNLKINDLELASGIYFVNLNYKNEKITRKLIIE